MIVFQFTVSNDKKDIFDVSAPLNNRHYIHFHHSSLYVLLFDFTRVRRVHRFSPLSVALHVFPQLVLGRERFRTPLAVRL